MPKLSETLRERGYVYQHSSEKLEEITDGRKRTVYLGIDPSSDSLHVGNLVGLLVLRRFLEDGHRVILLTGGGTGMIGDPGGKSEERNLLDEKTVEKNASAVAKQIRSVFGSSDFTGVNNAKWLSGLNLLEFLRDVGKYFTVNAMIKKDMVRERLEKESPISFTEFSYSLLQAYDFLYLHENFDCDVQVGGSDQWSNILAGVEFIRRKKDTTVYALTWPIIVNSSTGKKFGKTESGAVWLDAKKTAPFAFYQFWLNTADDNVEEYLKLFTLLSLPEIEAAMEMHRRDPKDRIAQQLLARQVTMLVHGAEVAEKAERVSQVLFGETDISMLDKKSVEMLRGVAPFADVSEGEAVIDVLVASKLASSKREARQFMSDKAISLNGMVVPDEKAAFSSGDFKNGIAILKRGGRTIVVLALR